jgi:hypothetical protein
MRRADTGAPEALLFEHVRAARKGPYSSAEFYAVEGLSGVFRRVPAVKQRDGVVRARYGSGHVHLVRDTLVETELVQAGFLKLSDGPPPSETPAPDGVPVREVPSRHADLPGQLTIEDYQPAPEGAAASAADVLAREGGD